MKRFAVLTGNSVTNVIIANSLEDAEIATKSICIDITDVKGIDIGWQIIEGNLIDPQSLITNAKVI